MALPLHAPLTNPAAFAYLIAASAAALVSGYTAQPSSDPLAAWLGTMYSGLNALRATSPADTPLRLRSALNDLAQSHASTLCTADAADTADNADTADTADVIQALAARGITVASGEMHSVGGQREPADALGVWGSEKPGATSAWSAIVYPAYVYVGLGRCNGSWVAVLTSEFL
ncbi:hypothetical protein LPJ53_005699 [Coemansia erecta]|uniref:SCP domain-containing protein n=1 Tax=Coemansia erecta TaxID=147472 RepID=A0A9W7XW76_9FUNG|nr:hypothetical protein LPJ53_005699 [Coemansia erecta]